MIMSETAFFIMLNIIIIVGGIIALKYADYEQRKKHGKV